MTAKEIISVHNFNSDIMPQTTVDADMPVLEVIPRLLESPGRVLAVNEDGNTIGVIDQTSLLEGIGKMIATRDDCSVITVECTPEEYSASIIAHAVEDTDAHLVDLFSTPFDNDKLRVTLRVRNSDPTSTIRSLERYDYHVVEAHSSSDGIRSLEIATERLLSLHAIMNV